MLRIRLQRSGRKNRPTYRVVVAEHSAPIQGRITDFIGSFDPLVEKHGLQVDMAKIEEWIKKGAKPTNTVARLLKGAGIKGMEPFIVEMKDKAVKNPKEEEAPAAEKASSEPPAEEKPAEEVTPEEAPAPAEEPAPEAEVEVPAEKPAAEAAPEDASAEVPEKPNEAPAPEAEDPAEESVPSAEAEEAESEEGGAVEENTEKKDNA